MGYHIITREGDKYFQWVAELGMSGKYDPEKHYVIEGDYEENVMWDPVNERFVPDPDQIREQNESFAYNERRRLLEETDYWAVGDRTMTQEQRDYRQALRDITEQEGFPDNVIWPIKPQV